MDATAPLELLDLAVEPGWIDYNGHMNVGYYVVAFDRGTDALIDALGMDAAYRERTGCSVFVLEIHVLYLRELKLGDTVRMDAQILDHDAKRIHYVLSMRHRGDVAAACEIMLMHVDLAAARGIPMPAPAHERLSRLAQEHARLPRPQVAGRQIAIRRA